jgi:hyperosmotically inducible protein
MRIVVALMVGLVIGAGAVWFYGTSRGKSTTRTTGQQMENAGKSARDFFEEKLGLVDLRTEDVKEDLARTGKVIRNKAREAGQAIVDSTADARITTAIKTKLLTNKDTSALNISVNTTEGIVTMAGPVNSMEEISKAMLVAMETQGVRRVISTMQVRNKPAKTG